LDILQHCVTVGNSAQWADTANRTFVTAQRPHSTFSQVAVKWAYPTLSPDNRFFAVSRIP